MRRKGIGILLVVLLVGTLSFLSGCGKQEPKNQVVETTKEQPAPEPSPAQIVPEPSKAVVSAEVFELQGDYAIDLSKLGMALKFYLRVDPDNNFVLSANRKFSDNRGSGTIGELDGTYLMIYADSTQEKSKTATFERVGHNLLFRSSLPYGSANIQFEAVDEDDPERIHRLMADKFVYEEYYDTYLAFDTVEGLESEYMLTFGPGAKYYYVSKYEVEDGSGVYEEKGTFKVSNKTIVLMPEGESGMAGTIAADGGLELDVKPTAQADRAKILFRVATTAEHAGSWFAQNEAGGQASLELDYFGGYVFRAFDVEKTLTEAGAFEVAAGTITFAQEGGEPVTGTKEGYTLNASFSGVEWSFYDGAVQGVLTGSTMVNEAYVATLMLHADGSYGLSIIDGDNEDAELINEEGTFAIAAGPMSYMITLNSNDSNVSVGDIWSTGLNMTFEIDGTSYSFLLTK